MPNSVTHVLIAMILATLIRDYFVKDKKKFPLHYILIAGIAGMLPDLDILLSWVGINIIHRTITHSFVFPLFFLILGLIPYNLKSLGKHKLKLNYIFLIIGAGIVLHIILDALIIGQIHWAYPFSNASFGLDLVSQVPIDSGTFIAGIDAILLILWLVHEEMKHKISSFF